MSELKPCPFCGCDLVTRHTGWLDHPKAKCILSGKVFHKGFIGQWNRRADMPPTLAAENDLLRAENEELDFLRHEGGPDSVAAMEIELATLRAERDAWTKIDVARDVDFATLRASEAAAMERITELEALLAASTHSPRLPE